MTKETKTAGWATMAAIKDNSRVQWLNDRVSERQKALNLVTEMMGAVYDTEDQEQLEKAQEALAKSVFAVRRERDRIVGEMMWNRK